MRPCDGRGPVSWQVCQRADFSRWNAEGSCDGTVDEQDTEWYELDIEKFIQGFRLWLENGGDCYGAVSGDGKVDCGEIDAGCADAIIQYALFGDLVFG